MKANEVFSMAKSDRKKIFYLAILALVAMVLFILSGTTEEKENNTSEPAGEIDSASSITSLMAETESQLESVLEKIDGVGNVRIAIQWAGETEKDYAYNEDISERTDENPDHSGESSVRKEMVLLDGDASPVIIAESLPDIIGVIVVAEGAYRGDIRESLSNVVSTYLGIGANRIEITAMEAGA